MLKLYVFNRDLNLIKLYAFLIKLGRPFQSLGAALTKALLPNVFFVPVVNGCNKSLLLERKL